MITWKFDSNLNFLEAKYIGEVNIQDMRDYQMELSKIKPLTKKLLILTDITEGKLMISEAEMPFIAESIKRMNSKFELVKNAFLVNTPLMTAISMIYKQSLEDLSNYHLEIFSTRQAALNFLFEKSKFD